MPAVQVSYYTDPACPWCWVLEPALRKLVREFDENSNSPTDLEGAKAVASEHYADGSDRVKLPSLDFCSQAERVGSGELWTPA